jgi:hypothetical protein
MAHASTAEALARLQTLASGLVHVSEADYPVSVIRLGLAEPSIARLLLATGKPAASPVQVVTVDAFFASATSDQTFHSAAERLIVERYRALVRFLTGELADSRVFRIGTIDIDVFAIGKTRESEWLGVATKVVET